MTPEWEEACRSLPCIGPTLQALPWMPMSSPEVRAAG